MLVSANAFGQENSEVPGLVLDWPDLPDCPSREQITASVQRALGSVTPRAQNVQARVTVERQSKWVLRLQTVSADGQGERELEGESCVQAAEALAVILAMLIDPEAARAVSSGEPARTESRAEPSADMARVTSWPQSTASVRFSGVVVPSARGRPSDSRFGVAAGAILNLGIEHTPRLGVGLSVDRAQGWLRWFLDASYWPEHDVHLPSDSRRGAHVSMGSVGASLGRRWPRGPFEIVPRLGLRGFAVRAIGFGVTQSLEGTSSWLAMTAGTVTNVDFGHSLGAALALDFVVPFGRPAALLEPGGDVLRASKIGAQAYFAGVFRF